MLQTLSTRLLATLALASAVLVSACDGDEPTPTPADTTAPDSLLTGDSDDVDHGSCDACAANAVCTNRGEAIVCVCKAGYFGDGLSCADENECSESVCSPLATCENTEGGYTCTCNQGYAGDGLSCTDLNECGRDELNDCDANARCINTEGSFDCACLEGFEGDGSSCTDEDECADATEDLCGPHGTCMNLPGNYGCDCDDGYVRVNDACVDADECALERDNCNANATCANTEGGFTCTCQDGFEGDGVTCDEVLTCDDITCGANASCSTVDGAARCTCNEGYEGNGQTCTVRNACRPSPCDVNATCRNNAGVAMCECDFGFEGDGRTCTEMNGCAYDDDGNGIIEEFEGFPCSEDATCTNVYGNGICECAEGFYEDLGGNCVNEGPMYCYSQETTCVDSCEDLMTSVDHCGYCGNACFDGQLCANGLCISDGTLRITLNWSREGDGDLYVLTPSENIISWENPGPDEWTDGAFLEYDGLYGPENLVWPVDAPIVDGTYYVCAWAYDYEPTVSPRAPVTFSAEVFQDGVSMRTFTKTVIEQLVWYPDDSQDPPDEVIPDCGPDSPALLGTFVYPFPN